MKLYRLSLLVMLVGLLIIGAGAAARAAESWVTDPATGCKIGWVHELSTLVSARWSGPVVDGKAQGKGNLSLTIKGNDGKEYKGQGTAEMIAGLLDGKVAIKWSFGDSYDGYYKAGQREGKGIYKYADGAIYDGEWKAGKEEGKGIYKTTKRTYDGEWKAGKKEGKGIEKLADGTVYEGEWKASKPDGKGIMKFADGASYDGELKAGKMEGKGIYKYADGSSYDGEWKNNNREGTATYKWPDGTIYTGAFKNEKRDGYGVQKDADGKIIYEGEWKNDKPVTQPKTAWAAVSWVSDPATGCKIGWASDTSTLISARWSGPVVDGKAQGKGSLSLTIKFNDGKELQGQGQAEMIVGLLDGKVAIKWSDDDSYDGFYKAGLREGKGIMKTAKGSYDGDWKDGKMEGKGIMKYADGRIYDGEWKNGKVNGHGVLKDAAGKIIYGGEWKDGKPFSQLKTDTVLGIPWGASEAEAKRIMGQRPNTTPDRDFPSLRGKNNLSYLQYDSTYNDLMAEIIITFHQGKMFAVNVLLESSEDELLNKFNSVKEGLTQRYGPPLSDEGKYLDSNVWWDLGGDYRTSLSITNLSKSFKKGYRSEPFLVCIVYCNRTIYEKLFPGPSGKDY